MNTKYVGKTYKNCSPSGAQQTALSNATTLASTLKSSYATVFGDASAMYQNLSSKLNSIISNPNGLDPATLARINAGTLARTAASEQQAQQAVNAKGAATSATPGVENGVTQEVRGQVVSNLEGEKNTELNNTAIQNAELGVSERDKALSEETKLPELFTPANQVAGTEGQAIGQESAQANENAAASNQWVGMLGGLANSAVGGLTSGLGAGLGKKIGN